MSLSTTLLISQPSHISPSPPLPSEPSVLPHDSSSQCRLRRIQSIENSIDPRTSPLPHMSIGLSTSSPDLGCSADVIHQNAGSSAAETASANYPFAIASASAALADAESDSDCPSLLSASTNSLSSSPQPAYPFPPPGLSKPLNPPSEMVTPDHESSSCTPRELELKSDLLFTSPSPSTAQPSSSEPDGSVWSAFRMESFLGNYCHATNSSKSLTPSLTHHDNNEDGKFDLPTACVMPRSSPPALSPAHWNRLKNHGKALTLHTAMPTPHTSPLPRLPSSSLMSSNGSHVSPSPVNPFMAQRQRQQAFMTHWNRVRQNNRYAPAMPSFFNPARSEAPGCSWNFLHDPTCGGNVNEKLRARRGRDSVFERALIKLPLTRCRSSCDRIRRDQQNLLGWGIHAWIGPSKHCRYCLGDEFKKGVLLFRAFEIERYYEEVRRHREQEQSILLITQEEVIQDDDAPESDAVFLSFPYRTPARDQIQRVPTEPWIDYNDLDSANHTHSSCISQTPPGMNPRSNPDPRDVPAWSAELEKRLLASPVIRDIDDFDMEDDDLDGFDDEDLDGYYDSDEEEEEEEGYSSSGSSSPTSDTCGCDAESGCGCPRIITGEPEPESEMKSAVVEEVEKDTLDSKSKNDFDKTTTAICEKVLMSFWEEDSDLDGVDCVRVDVEAVDGCCGVGGVGEDEKWVVDEMRVVVQVQA